MKSREIKKLIIIICVIILIAAVTIALVLFMRQQSKVSQSGQKDIDQSTVNQPATNTTTPLITATSTLESSGFSWPIDGALARVTKKPFGLYISPNTSPVSPEHFTGYHTGADFETTDQEKNVDVPIHAICTGPLILKKTATGYGGVAVQSCKINKSPVTIIYGHLRLASIVAELNTILNQGQQIGLLGQGYSLETADERKHLHLGIHKSGTVNLLGYVPDKNKLSQWIDFLTLMK